MILMIIRCISVKMVLGPSIEGQKATQERQGGLLGLRDLKETKVIKAFVDLNTSPRLGIALAPYHIQTLKASVPDAIRICGKQLLFFYAWQHQDGAKQLPGIGSTDMTPWVEALASVRYRGYVNPFMHGHPDPKRATPLWPWGGRGLRTLK